MTIEYSYPHPYDVIFNSLLAVVPGIGFAITFQDIRTGQMNASAGLSFASWGENLQLRVGGVDPNNSVVAVTSNLKFGLVAWGKNRRNEEKVHAALNGYLHQYFGPGGAPPGAGGPPPGAGGAPPG